MSRKTEIKRVAKVVIKPTQLVEPARSDFKKLIIQNPNYFGTFPETKMKIVQPIQTNVKYEELKCVGFTPETDMLEAVINVKLSYGYSGGLCSAGSIEYVRFFVDWNGNGNFEDEGEDVGISSVNVHDIPSEETACLTETKPLSYAVTLKLDPSKRVCTSPYLVKIRAILSWDMPPPAGNPNFIPVWGNVVEKWIQIQPMQFLLKDIIKVVNLDKVKINTAMLNLDLPISKAKTLTSAELKKLYAQKDVPELRFNLPEVVQLAAKIKSDPSIMVKYKAVPKYSSYLKDVEFVLFGDPSTKYEQLNCIGLNYDLDNLVGTLTVKLPSGYCGNLCTTGSYEYVAFWAYVWDQIEQMCYWKYLGTSKVNVHDIDSLPANGLQYAVCLPVDLSSYKDLCGNPQILKIRGILSWQNPPPTNDPNYNPVWGNVVEKMIQLKPVHCPIDEGDQIPYISAVGGMAVANISGNPDTAMTSSLGDGYANGTSILGGYTGLESPFGGLIAICGHISYPPDDPEPYEKLIYKVQYRKGSSNWQDITDQFDIWITTETSASFSMHKKTQVATEGYFTYEVDLDEPTRRYVEGDVLAQWHTPVGAGNGLYEIRVLLYTPGAPIVPGVPLDHVSSNVVKVMVDNTAPEAKVYLDAGACTKFTVGDIITGWFKAKDDHIEQYKLIVEPTVAVAPTINPTKEEYPLLSAPGHDHESFTLTTTSSTTPCGYVIHLHVWDRTIRNNSGHGNYNDATVGLCLLEKT